MIVLNGPYGRYPSYNNSPPGSRYVNNNRTRTPAANRPAGNTGSHTRFSDHGPGPFVINIEEVTKQNNTFRTALWTGEHLQLTLMSINPGEDIGLEAHPDLDQFIRIEEGSGIIVMGDKKDYMNFQRNVAAEYAFIIPAGKWHNLINSGRTPLKLYSIYAPPQHPFGTVHVTKADAEAAESHNDY